MDVIAIDGPAGAGKSSIARRLAEDLGWAYLDTGAMYRAVTLAALERHVALEEGPALTALAAGLPLRVLPDGHVRVGERDVTREIRSPEVTAGVSLVAAVAGVRAAMVGHQRRFAVQNGQVVAEGRDIGTVVFPDAKVKIYLDATPRERAERRAAEMKEKQGAAGDDPEADVRAVQAGIERRDHLDSSRSASPLRQAEDAWYLDTTGLTLAQVYDRIRSHVTSRIRPRPGG